MPKNPNGRNLRGWLAMAGWAAVIITLVVLVLNGGRALGRQEATLVGHEKRIKKVEAAQKDITAIKLEVMRIRTILEQDVKRRSEPCEPDG